MSPGSYLHNIIIWGLEMRQITLELAITIVTYLTSGLPPPILTSFNKPNVPVSPDYPVIQLCPTDVPHRILGRLTKIVS